MKVGGEEAIEHDDAVSEPRIGMTSNLQAEPTSSSSPISSGGPGGEARPLSWEKLSAAALLRASPVATFLSIALDDETTIAAVNPAFLALVGFAEEELLGKSLGTIQSRSGDTAAWACLRSATRRIDAETEVLCTRKDRTSFWASIAFGEPIETGDGAFAQIGQIVDISRCKDAEGGLLLSQQREALGLLTNSVAHEFNNFLQILIGYIDGLKRRLGDRQEPFVQRAIGRSTEAAERAAALTRQLLAHSRRIAPDVRPVDLDALVAATGENLRPHLPARISLTVERMSGLPPALCNPTQVALAIQHILNNSVEAILEDRAEKNGTIILSTFAVPPGDAALQRPTDGAVGIAVTDHGHGMSPEMLTRALVPFATSREAGRGVGLAIVHGLMKRQNGTIAFDSRQGEGTTVRLVFPGVP